ncbi:uncharacterized protein [Eucyclogobius newberryi]|uniref:uncharacterized protein n=1 Tax=Eucyclogobius newberryi TaxID=166745 RepID=UPI003B59E40B
MVKSKTKNQKKARASANHVAEETYGAVPHTFVFNRGQIGKNVAQLVLDVRKVMQPYTAESLKIRKKNVLKDFVAIAGPLGVTHFVMFSKTPSSINLRVARLPKGPTLHFKVVKYALVKDVVSALKKHRMHEQQFTHHPLLILNNFGSNGMHVKLMATMFQNMFPSINVHKVNLNNIKRCVLLNYNQESEEIEFRHYSLKVVPVGMSRGVKKLMQERFPNMNKFEDISELLIKGANLSESEAEQDGDHNITELPQAYSGRGNMASQQSAVRLTEIGPRLTLKLSKIEEGMGGGNILYHSVITKTEEEIQEILKRKEAQLKAKQERRKKQDQNVAQKKDQKDKHKLKSLEGIKRKSADADGDSEVEDPGAQDDKVKVASDDEVEYYRQAVGQEPDEDMFPAAKRRRMRDTSNGPSHGKPSHGKPSNKDKYDKSPKRYGPGADRADKTGKPWKKYGDSEKPFSKKYTPGGKPFNKKKPGGAEKFGKNKFYSDKKYTNKDNKFKPKGQKGKPGFKKPDGGKRGFKPRKQFGYCWKLKMKPDIKGCETFQISLLPWLYGIEFAVALVGNIFALYLFVTKERRNWHAGIVLSCNLAISDLLYILTLPLLIVYYVQQKHWTFRNAACKIERFLFSLNLYASIFFITAISVNRCVALKYPFFSRTHLGPRQAKVTSVIIWALVGVICSPVLKFASTCPDMHSNKTVCVSNCNQHNAELSHFNYKMFLSVFGCLIPFLITFASYCVVVQVVWKSLSITTQERRKVALLVMSVVVLYAISFLPYHLFNMYHFHLKMVKKVNCFIYNLYQVTKGLATLNMCIHPLLYMVVFDSIKVACCGERQGKI